MSETGSTDRIGARTYPLPSHSRHSTDRDIRDGFSGSNSASSIWKITPGKIVKPQKGQATYTAKCKTRQSPSQCHFCQEHIISKSESRAEPLYSRRVASCAECARDSHGGRARHTTAARCHRLIR
eukprot:1099351-Rhodomonas_salina.1